MSAKSTARAGVFSGAGLALISAALFGASTPLAKLLLRDIDPWMLAGILYLGSGVGLIGLKFLSVASGGGHSESKLRGTDWLWLGSAILSGGLIGPVLLMVGLARSTAATASLLLNLEGVFTALLAWFVFHENFDRRIALGMAAIVAGGLTLSTGDAPTAGGFFGPLAIAGACLAWAIDNNLTRRISQADPVQIAMLKGSVAGTVNVAIALARGSSGPGPASLALAGVVGFVGYGLSLVLFVVALRNLGTARTGAYFSLAPFFGGVLAVLVLHEAVTARLLVAGALMALGVYLHLTERHETNTSTRRWPTSTVTFTMSTTSMFTTARSRPENRTHTGTCTSLCGTAIRTIPTCTTATPTELPPQAFSAEADGQAEIHSASSRPAVLNPKIAGRRLRRMPRAAPAIMSLKTPSLVIVRASSVAASMATANGSGTAAGTSRTRDTARTPMTAGAIPFITARIQASFLTRSRTGKMTSMITKEGRKAATAATAAPPAPATL